MLDGDHSIYSDAGGVRHEQRCCRKRVNESLLSRKKRSVSAPHDAARKCAGFGAGHRTGDYRTDVVHVAPTGQRTRSRSAGRWEESRRMVFGRQVCGSAGTAPLNAAELAEYCRRKGLYPEQIAAWRAACQAADANAAEQAREQRHQSKDDKKRIQQLEKELQRKEKALAEAAALVILRKKSRRSGDVRAESGEGYCIWLATTWPRGALLPQVQKLSVRRQFANLRRAFRRYFSNAT
ncbi:hypothetical protein OKW29_001312 [Paraburkholderia sp. CI3]